MQVAAEMLWDFFFFTLPSRSDACKQPLRVWVSVWREKRSYIHIHTEVTFELFFFLGGWVTDQQENVAVDFPDQAGLLFVPPLNVDQLPVLYLDNRLAGSRNESQTHIQRASEDHLNQWFGFLLFHCALHHCADIFIGSYRTFPISWQACKRIPKVTY